MKTAAMRTMMAGPRTVGLGCFSSVQKTFDDIAAIGIALEKSSNNSTSVALETSSDSIIIQQFHGRNPTIMSVLYGRHPMTV
jgi:hypothetical protein